jgi:hypothetical protein
LQALGKKVAGSMYNGLRSKQLKKLQPLDERFKRVPLNRGKIELDNIARDAFLTADAAYRDVDEGRPPYSAPNPQQCGWKCGYKEVHLITRTGYPVGDAMEDYGFSRGEARYSTPTEVENT